MNASQNFTSLPTRIGAGAVVGAGGVAFATAASLAGAGMAAWAGQASELSLISNVITGAVVVGGTLAASVFAAQVIKKGVEVISDEGKMVWEHIAQTTLGKSLIELNEKVGEFKYVAATAALAATPAAAFDHIHQATQHPFMLATIGVGVLVPVVAMEALGEQDKMAQRVEARRAKNTPPEKAPRLSIP